MLNFSTLFYYPLQALIIKIKRMLEMFYFACNQSKKTWTFHLLNISDGKKEDFGDIQIL